MQKPYFVILYTHNSYTPLFDNSAEIAKFESFEEAEDSAANNVLGKNYGWCVFIMGEGCIP